MHQRQSYELSQVEELVVPQPRQIVKEGEALEWTMHQRAFGFLQNTTYQFAAQAAEINSRFRRWITVEVLGSRQESYFYGSQFFFTFEIQT